MAFKKAGFIRATSAHRLGLAAGVLGHRLRPFGYGVLGQFTGQQKSDGCLDFATRDGRPFVVVSQTACLSCNALEDVVDERVHDAHGL